jgi:hypothetical protein
VETALERVPSRSVPAAISAGQTPRSVTGSVGLSRYQRCRWKRMAVTSRGRTIPRAQVGARKGAGDWLGHLEQSPCGLLRSLARGDADQDADVS